MEKRLPNPAVTYTVMRTLKPGEKWDSGKAPAFAADAEYSITVSGSSAAVLRNAVDWLNRYPYGCLEQTVSAAFPFLSAPERRSSSSAPRRDSAEPRPRGCSDDTRMFLVAIQFSKSARKRS